MPRNEHESLMDELNTDEPEILSLNESAELDNEFDLDMEALYFLDNNPFGE